MAQFLYLEGIVLIILLILLPLFFTIKKKPKSQTPPLPPGPKSWPILAAVNHLRRPKTDHISLANLAQTYGPLMHYKLGTQLTIVASSPAAAAAILRDNDSALSGRPPLHAIPKTAAQIDRLSFGADTTSEHRKNLRTVCRAELFSAKALDRYSGLRDEKAAEMVAALRSKEEAAVNIEQIILATVVNISSNTYFSEDVAVGDDNPMVEILEEIGLLLAPNVSDLYPFLGWLDLQGLRRKCKKVYAKMWELWRPILEERRALEVRHDDFLDNLISRGFGDDQINNLLEDLIPMSPFLQELLFAGTHATTSTITRTMMELIKSPSSMDKLKEELDVAFDGQDSFTSSPVENLPYLRACIKETLRLHPPAKLGIPHYAYTACHVMGYTIPKNARIVVNLWAIGHDPTAWEEPLQYRPERFVNSSIDFKGNHFEFLPFGSGRRICPGMSMADKIVSLLVASLVYFFDWSTIEGSLLLVPRPRK